MGVKRRKSKRKEPITDAESAWLRGECDFGFTGFKADDYLQNLWDSHGDPARFAWTVGQLRPVQVPAAQQEVNN